LQRLIEGQNLDIRLLLRKYEGLVEGQRQIIQQQRQDVLTGATPSTSELERLVSLATIDDLWSEHLAAVADLRVGSQWVSWGGRDPLSRYLNEVHSMFRELQTTIVAEIPRRLAEAESSGSDPSRRGATWTYLTTDQPFGSLQERFVQGCLNRLPALQAGLQSAGSRTERIWLRLSQKLSKRSSRDGECIVIPIVGATAIMKRPGATETILRLISRCSRHGVIMNRSRTMYQSLLSMTRDAI
jgi:hypothetical protein